MRLLARVVFVELVCTTALTCVAASALVLAGGAVFEASRQGLDPMVVLRALPYLIPPTIPYTLPSALLLACTVVYGRMSAQGEIIALKASGISASRIIWPAIIIALASVSLGLYLSDRFIPRTKQAVRDLVLDTLQQNLYAYLSLHGGLSEPGEDGDIHEIYVRDVRGDRLIDLTYKHRSADGGYDLAIQAREATLHISHSEDGKGAAVILHMFDGEATMSSKQGSLLFEEREEQMKIPKFSFAKEPGMDTMTFHGCLSRAATRKEERRELDYELASLGAVAVLFGDPALLSEQLEPNRRQAARAERKSREAVAELHLRLAQSSVALPFVLLGCPISILLRRKDFLHAFFVCFLPIITGYYPLMILAFNFYKEGTGPGCLLFWAPAAAMTAVALFLWSRVQRH